MKAIALPKSLEHLVSNKCKLDEFVRTMAKSTSLNLPQYRELKRVCREMVEFAEEHKIGMSFLAYIGVSTMAHKKGGFLASYGKWDKERALAINTMAEYFAKHFGFKKANDRELHAFYAIYTKCTKDVDAVKATIDSMGKDDYVRGTSAKELAAMVAKKLEVCSSSEVVEVAVAN